MEKMKLTDAETIRIKEDADAISLEFCKLIAEKEVGPHIAVLGLGMALGAVCAIGVHEGAINKERVDPMLISLYSSAIKPRYDEVSETLKDEDNGK